MTATQTGDPGLLADAVAANPVSPEIEAFLASLELSAEDREAVRASMPMLQKAITQAEGAPSITVYGGNWV